VSVQHPWGSCFGVWCNLVTPSASVPPRVSVLPTPFCYLGFAKGGKVRKNAESWGLVLGILEQARFVLDTVLHFSTSGCRYYRQPRAIKHPKSAEKCRKLGAYFCGCFVCCSSLAIFRVWVCAAAGKASTSLSRRCVSDVATTDTIGRMQLKPENTGFGVCRLFSACFLSPV
jgi:hypothetical protein